MTHSRRTLGYLWLLFLALLCFLPFWVPSYFQYILILTLLYAFLAGSWNVIGGMGGQLSIGHATYFGIGAYASTILFQKYDLSPWIGMWIGGLLAASAAAFIGFLCFRYKVKGVYFALVTLAFAEISRIIAVNLKLLGKSEGILVPLKGHSWAAFQFESKLPYYFIILGMAAILFTLLQYFRSSRFISYLMAVREDEDAAQASGIDIFKTKLYGIMASGFLTALGGTFFAQYTLYIDPPSMFGMMRSFDPVVICIIGGVGTVFGPIIGSVVFTSLMEVINHILKGGFGSSHLILYGLLLMIVIIAFPQGLSSITKKLKTRD
jgi:branched-chain amino acid transport system permease protein